MKKNTLLLTATIVPTARGNVTRRSEPAIRRTDYENTLRFYLNLSNNTFDQIIFCENSGADLTSLKLIVKNENPYGVDVLFHSSIADCNPEYGKGHSELQMMDRVFIDFIEQDNGSRVYWKLTGRIKIKNIERLLIKAPKQFEFYIDMRLVPKWLTFFGNDHWADTRIIGFTQEGYRKHLLNKKSIVGTPGNSYIVEYALFQDLMNSYLSGEPLIPRFNIQPVMVGVGAESLKNYNDIPSRLKNFIRSLTRIVFPKLWL